MICVYCNTSDHAPWDPCPALAAQQAKPMEAQYDQFVEIDRKADGLYAIANAIGSLAAVLAKQVIVATAHPNEAVTETAPVIRGPITLAEKEKFAEEYQSYPSLSVRGSAVFALESFARSRGLL